MCSKDTEVWYNIVNKSPEMSIRWYLWLQQQVVGTPGYLDETSGAVSEKLLVERQGQTPRNEMRKET